MSIVTGYVLTVNMEELMLFCMRFAASMHTAIEPSQSGPASFRFTAPLEVTVPILQALELKYPTKCLYCELILPEPRGAAA